MIKWVNNFWLSRGYKADKPKHFWLLGSLPASGTVLICFFHFFRPYEWRVLLTVAAAYAIVNAFGIGKEAIDWKQGKDGMRGKRWDWMDIGAANMGATLVVVIFMVLYVLYLLIR